MDVEQFTPCDAARSWLDALAAGDADIAAGRTVPFDQAYAGWVKLLAEREAEQGLRRA